MFLLQRTCGRQRLPSISSQPPERAITSANSSSQSGARADRTVVGRDNGGGANQQDIPCQDIVLSDNVFDSGGTPDVQTSGYSAFGTQRPGATVHAFETAMHHGVCDGAILRARLDAQVPDTTIEPYSWGYRNGYAIRFCAAASCSARTNAGRRGWSG
jgi:hypothetical protein